MAGGSNDGLAHPHTRWRRITPKRLTTHPHMLPMETADRLHDTPPQHQRLQLLTYTYSPKAKSGRTRRTHTSTRRPATPERCKHNTAPSLRGRRRQNKSSQYMAHPTHKTCTHPRQGAQHTHIPRGLVGIHSLVVPDGTTAAAQTRVDHTTITPDTQKNRGVTNTTKTRAQKAQTGG